jgi:hypothetical protein
VISRGLPKEPKPGREADVSGTAAPNERAHEPDDHPSEMSCVKRRTLTAPIHSAFS